MPISNYNRFPQGVNIGGFNVLNTYAGNVFWVDSGTGADGNKGTHRQPLATVDNAIGKCTANNGDIIVLFPGHSETVATSIAADVAGISIIGLGAGSDMASLMGPKTDACIDVSAANITIKGVKFLAQTGTTQAATQQINVAAAYCTIEDCVFLNGVYDDDSVYVMVTGDYLAVRNCEWWVTANGPDTAIYLDGADNSDTLTGVLIENSYFNGGSVTNAWDNGTIYSSGVHTQCRLKSNIFAHVASGVGAIEFIAAATGTIADNYFGNGTIAQMLDPGSCMCFGNLQADAVDETGSALPPTGATT